MLLSAGSSWESLSLVGGPFWGTEEADEEDESEEEEALSEEGSGRGLLAATGGWPEELLVDTARCNPPLGVDGTIPGVCGVIVVSVWAAAN